MSDYQKSVRRKSNISKCEYTGEIVFANALSETAVNRPMTKQEYIQFHLDFCADMARITEEKNSDYTGNSTDPFENFTVCERNNLVSTEIGLLVRMSDKMSRLTTFAKVGKLMVKDESVRDTLIDLANYAALLAGYIESRKK